MVTIVFILLVQLTLDLLRHSLRPGANLDVLGLTQKTRPIINKGKCGALRSLCLKLTHKLKTRDLISYTTTPILLIK